MKFYTITEVAKLLKVSRVTVYDWIEKGKMKAVELPGLKNGRLRITEKELEKLLK